MHYLNIEKMMWFAITIYWIVSAIFVKKTIKRQPAPETNCIYNLCFDCFLSSFRKLYFVCIFIPPGSVSIGSMEDGRSVALRHRTHFFSDGKNLSGRKLEWNYNNKERSSTDSVRSLRHHQEPHLYRFSHSFYRMRHESGAVEGMDRYNIFTRSHAGQDKKRRRIYE